MKVVLRCTVVVKVFRLRLTRTSKNGISWFSSNSIVKLIFGCLVLRYCRNLVAEATLSNNAKVSSTYLNQMEGRESTLATHFSSKNKSVEPIATVPKKDIFLVLPFLGSQSEVLARRVKSCVSKFYAFVNLRVIFNNTCRIKSFFPYKDRINRSQRSKVVYRANCWDCDSFYVGKTKRRLHDRKTEHFKALSQGCHASALADHVISTGHNIKWDHFDILTTGKSDLQCKIKETLLISELKPSLNENVGSEKLFLY